MDFNAIIGIPYYLDVEMEEEEEENPLIAVKKYREIFLKYLSGVGQ
jgi:hypothetical protein